MLESIITLINYLNVNNYIRLNPGLGSKSLFNHNGIEFDKSRLDLTLDF